MAFPKKKILYTAGVLVLLGGTNAATFYFTDKNASETKQLPALSAPAPEQPSDSNKDGALNPQDVALTPQTYDGKQIKIKGTIVPAPDNTYTIVDMKAQRPLGVKLNPGSFEEDVKKYANPAPVSGDQQPESAVVTIEGTLNSNKNSDGSFGYVLNISAINK